MMFENMSIELASFSFLTALSLEPVKYYLGDWSLTSSLREIPPPSLLTKMLAKAELWIWEAPPSLWVLNPQ